MKLTRIATAISLSLMTTAAFAAEANVDFYGSLRIALNKDDKAIGSDDELSRIGIKSSKKLDHGLTAVAQLEYEVDHYHQKEGLSLRLGYVGIKGKFGELYHGSQTTVWHKFVRGAYFSNGSDSLRMYSIRDDGLTHYYYKNGGLTVGAGIQTENTGSGNSSDGNNIDSLQAGAEYKTGNFKGQVALLKDKTGDNEGMLLGARVWYTADQLTLSAFTQRAQSDYDFTTSNICSGEATATNAVYGAYKMGVHKVHARYALNSCDDSGDLASKKVEYVNALDKQMQVWLSVERLDTVRDHGDAKTLAELGVRYDF